MDNVVILRKQTAPFKSLHCKKCNGHKFSALQDESTIEFKLWCVECWTVADNIELKDTRAKRR